MGKTSIHLETLYTDLKTSMSDLRKQHDGVRQSRKIVAAALLDGQAHYGINTGFGVLANKRISTDDLATLQQNILLSHACGVGMPVAPEITRLMLQLKIQSLSLGFSGVSEQTFEQLLKLEEHDILPWVPSRGSVGASGDLAPLAHQALRSEIKHAVKDYEVRGDLDLCADMLRSGSFLGTVDSKLGPLG